MPVQEQKLPDSYLNIGIFRDYAKISEVDALFDTVNRTIKRLSEILAIDTRIQIKQPIWSEDDCETKINALEDQITALRIGTQHILDYGFPEMIHIESDSRQARCNSLSQALRDLLKRAESDFCLVPHTYMNLYIKLMQYRQAILQCAQRLDVAAKPYHDLDEYQKYLRLRGMLSFTRLIENNQQLELDQDRLRLVSELLCNDESLSTDYRHDVSFYLLKQVQQSTLMKFLSRYEFYSLLMLLLSDQINTSVRHETWKILHAKLRMCALSIHVKIQYYQIFIDVIECHCQKDQQNNLLQKMCAEIEYDEYELYASDPDRSLLTPINTLLHCRYEYSLYAVLTGAERSSVCEKLIQKVEGVLQHLSDCNFIRTAYKTKMVLTVDQRIETLKQNNQLRRDAFGFFWAKSIHAAEKQAYQKLILDIWMCPLGIDECKNLIEKIECYQPQSDQQDQFIADLNNLVSMSEKICQNKSSIPESEQKMTAKQSI